MGGRNCDDKKERVGLCPSGSKIPVECPLVQPSRECIIPQEPVEPIPDDDDIDDDDGNNIGWYILIIAVFIILVFCIIWSVRKKRMANGVQKWGWMAIIVLMIFAVIMFGFGLFYDDGDIVITTASLPPEDPVIQSGEFHVIYPNNSGSAPQCGDGDLFYDFNAQEFEDGPSCNLNITSRWNADGCECIPPFYGNECQREAYADNYFEAGTIGERCVDGVEYKVLREVNADRLSFPFQGFGETSCDQTMCTQECDRDRECTGVVWNGSGKCTLICGNVYLEGSDDITWNRNCDSNLYLKNDDTCKRKNMKGRDVGFTRHLKFPDMVWVWKEALSLRYYLADVSTSDGIQAATPLMINVAKRLDFNPEGSANQGKLLGVYTTFRVNADEAQEIACNRKCVGRSPSGSKFLVKDVWFDKPGKKFPIIPIVNTLWVIYIKCRC